MKLIQLAFILTFLIGVSFVGNEVEATVGSQDFGLKVGTAAPDFSAVTNAGNKVTLSLLYKKGPVVLIFYSGGWCPVCSLYLKTVQLHLQDFKKAGIRLLAVSGDRTEYVRRFVKKEGLGFDVISDPQENILKIYNVQYIVPQASVREYINRYHIDKSDYMGRRGFAIAVPAEYVIGRNGKIIFARENFKVREKVEEILDLLKSRKNL
ncbi:MAG: redoxin domain-containing protein [Candidatus Omnitrophica bacterium]|nr:redoxin domain-containing protein [Candidatus Omnitrophota bacterium]